MLRVGSAAPGRRPAHGVQSPIPGFPSFPYFLIISFPNILILPDNPPEWLPRARHRALGERTPWILEAQNASKMPPRWPSGRQDTSKRPQDAPKRPQDAFKTAQEVSKTVPRGPKTPPRRVFGTFGRLYGNKLAPKSHHELILCDVRTKAQNYYFCSIVPDGHCTCSNYGKN